MSPDDETRLQQLLDRTEISDVMTRYATGSDTRDWELLRTCFTDDLEIDFSSGFGMPIMHQTADEWVESIPRNQPALNAAHHTITNHLIAFDDTDHATCTAYLLASQHHPNHTGDSDQIIYGVYTNQFERTSNGWRIAKLKLAVRWMRGNAAIFGAVLQERR